MKRLSIFTFLILTAGCGSSELSGRRYSALSTGALMVASSLASAAVAPASFDEDMRNYFPQSYRRNVSRKQDGSMYSDYRFYPATVDFNNLYRMLMDLGKPGRLMVWEKRYAPSNDTCIATYANLFLGDDMSVTEVGDWYANNGCNPDVAFGYSDSTLSRPDGLAWSAPGGIRNLAYKEGLGIQRQVTPGSAYVNYGTHGYKAWNHTVLKETLPTYTPPYGRSPTGAWGRGLSKTYRDVIKIIFYHGTQMPGQQPINCGSKPDYVSKPGYHTYASEIYFAKGIGIIQESFLYTESGAYWNMPNCSGSTMDNSGAKWTSYIDEI